MRPNMKILLCLTKQTERGKYILESFAKGCREHGDRTQWLLSVQDADEYVRECDVAVQICTSNEHDNRPGSPAFRHHIRKRLDKHGKRCIVIDSGFLKTQTDLELAEDVSKSSRPFNTGIRATFDRVDESVYYQVGYDGLKGVADYYNEDSPPGRWQSLNTKLEPWIKTNLPGARDNRHILMLGQTYHGASSQHVDIYDWYRKAAEDIRKVSKRHIIFRQHPRLFKNSRRRSRDLNRVQRALGKSRPYTVSTRWTLDEDLENAFAVVVFSSNAGIIPVIKGIPTFVGDKACMAKPVSAGKLHSIEEPRHPNRDQWAYNLAYCQWNCAEMANGDCWSHFREYAEK